MKLRLATALAAASLMLLSVSASAQTETKPDTKKEAPKAPPKAVPKEAPKVGDEAKKTPPKTAEAPKSQKVILETSAGTIEIELDGSKAPKTVSNFVAYVKAGQYDGTIFHRVIDGFMIQGGGYDTSLKEKPTNAPITNEADNGLKNERGTIAMARTNDPNSATAQFFINVKNNDALNFRQKSGSGWGYAVFGKVTNGMEVVDKIKAMKTGSCGPFPTDCPSTQIVIKKAVVK